LEFLGKGCSIGQPFLFISVRITLGKFQTFLKFGKAYFLYPDFSFQHHKNFWKVLNFPEVGERDDFANKMNNTAFTFN
jgi:hypothetical protein